MKKDFVEKIKNFGIKVRGKAAGLALAVTSGVETGIVMAGSGTAKAADSWKDGFNTSANGGQLVGGILDIVVNIFIFMGAFFVVSGVYKLVMAYKDNQPEQQNAAVRDIVIGVVLIVFRVALWKPLRNVLFSGVTWSQD